jgi:hypothetical protein
VPSGWHEVCLYETFEDLLARLRWALTHRQQMQSWSAELRQAVARFDWGVMGPRYDEALEALVLPVPNVPIR